MAGKRINSEAPLTAAKKQSRYRQKKKEDEAASDEAALAKMEKKMRELLIDHIKVMGREELFSLYDMVSSPDKYMKKYCSLKELSDATGLSLYELKKLESQGVISPVIT